MQVVERSWIGTVVYKACKHINNFISGEAECCRLTDFLTASFSSTRELDATASHANLDQVRHLIEKLSHIINNGCHVPVTGLHDCSIGMNAVAG
jgi:hypothetical protein